MVSQLSSHRMLGKAAKSVYVTSLCSLAAAAGLSKKATVGHHCAVMITNHEGQIKLHLQKPLAMNSGFMSHKASVGGYKFCMPQSTSCMNRAPAGTILALPTETILEMPAYKRPEFCYAENSPQNLLAEDG